MRRGRLRVAGERGGEGEKAYVFIGDTYRLLVTLARTGVISDLISTTQSLLSIAILATRHILPL